MAYPDSVYSVRKKALTNNISKQQLKTFLIAHPVIVNHSQHRSTRGYISKYKVKVPKGGVMLNSAAASGVEPATYSKTSHLTQRKFILSLYGNMRSIFTALT